jgi:hypothetical protein
MPGQSVSQYALGDNRFGHETYPHYEGDEREPSPRWKVVDVHYCEAHC